MSKPKDGRDAKVHEVSLVAEGSVPDQANPNGTDAILDAMYRECADSSSRCVVYFGSKHYAKDYIPLVVRYSRDFIKYFDEGGHVRYSFCDATISGDGCDTEFGYLQDTDGTIRIFACGERRSCDIVLSTEPQDEELEPVAAWSRGENLFLVMNTPSDDMLDTVAPRDRLPLTSKNGGRAFGCLSMWRIPIGAGRAECTDLTLPMDGWCASVIPNAVDGRPGLMIVNMAPHRERRSEPRTFKSLIRAIRAVTSTGTEVEVPMGVSVYDPEQRTFERISVGGHVDWGIGSIQFVGQEGMPDEVREAEMDDMGVSLLVYDSEVERRGSEGISEEGTSQKESDEPLDADAN